MGEVEPLGRPRAALLRDDVELALVIAIEAGDAAAQEVEAERPQVGVGRDQPERLVQTFGRGEVRGGRLLVELGCQDRPELVRVDELARTGLGGDQPADPCDLAFDQVVRGLRLGVLGADGTIEPKAPPRSAGGGARARAGLDDGAAEAGCDVPVAGLDGGTAALGGAEGTASPHAAARSPMTIAAASRRDPRRRRAAPERGCDMRGIVARSRDSARRGPRDIAFLIGSAVAPESGVPSVMRWANPKRFHPSLPRPGAPIGQAPPVFLLSVAVGRRPMRLGSGSLTQSGRGSRGVASSSERLSPRLPPRPPCQFSARTGAPCIRGAGGKGSAVAWYGHSCIRSEVGRRGGGGSVPAVVGPTGGDHGRHRHVQPSRRSSAGARQGEAPRATA